MKTKVLLLCVLVGTVWCSPNVSWQKRKSPADRPSFSIVFTDKAGRVSRVILKNETTEISKARACGERILVLGRVGTAAEIVSVLNSKSGRLVDSFLAYHPVISPDCSKVAFRQFYPRFSAPETIPNLIRIYDVGTQPKPQKRGLPRSDAGIVVYPTTESGTREIYHKMVWDDGRLVFLDHRQEGWYAVSVSRSDSRSSVKEKRISELDAVNTSRTPVSDLHVKAGLMRVDLLPSPGAPKFIETSFP